MANAAFEGDASPMKNVDHKWLAAAAVSGILTGLGCGGGRAAEAAVMKAAPFTEPAASGAPTGESDGGAKMSCSPDMKGMSPAPAASAAQPADSATPSKMSCSAGMKGMKPHS